MWKCMPTCQFDQFNPKISKIVVDYTLPLLKYCRPQYSVIVRNCSIGTGYLLFIDPRGPVSPTKKMY